jgi:hypothetical protein
LIVSLSVFVVVVEPTHDDDICRVCRDKVIGSKTGGNRVTLYILPGLTIPHLQHREIGHRTAGPPMVVTSTRNERIRRMQ